MSTPPTIHCSSCEQPLSVPRARRARRLAWALGVHVVLSAIFGSSGGSSDEWGERYEVKCPQCGATSKFRVDFNGALKPVNQK